MLLLLANNERLDCRSSHLYKDLNLDELAPDLHRYVEWVKNSPQLDNDDAQHPALFWKTSPYGTLAVVARRVFALSYTTAPIESAFNYKRKLQDPTRSTMSNDRFASFFLLAANGPRSDWHHKLAIEDTDDRKSQYQ
jgi:hypothetical protein